MVEANGGMPGSALVRFGQSGLCRVPRGDVVAEPGGKLGQERVEMGNCGEGRAGVWRAEGEEGGRKRRDWFSRPCVRGRGAPLHPWGSAAKAVLHPAGIRPDALAPVEEQGGGSSENQDGEHWQKKKERREKKIYQRVRNEQLQTKR